MGALVSPIAWNGIMMDRPERFFILKGCFISPGIVMFMAIGRQGWGCGIAKAALFTGVCLSHSVVLRPDPSKFRGLVNVSCSTKCNVDKLARLACFIRILGNKLNGEEVYSLVLET